MRLRLSMLAAVIAAGALVFGCGGGGGGGGGGGSAGIGPRGAGTLTTVGATAFVINMYGGKGNLNSGGDGADLWAESYGTGGCIVGTAGTIDTRFIYPADPDGDLGSDGLEVTANLTIDRVYVTEAAANADATLLNGTYFLLLADQKIHLRDSVGGNVVITGLDVYAGRTLTLGLNYSDGGNTGQDMAYVTFSDDVRIAGTVKTLDLTTGDANGATLDTRYGTSSALDKGALDLEANKMLITSTGRINLAGGNATAANTRGGDGGYLYLYADAVLVIHGAIDCKGGNGAGTGVGGGGGVSSSGNIYLELESAGAVINTATLNVSGGSGSDGGDAGEFNIYADYHIYNTGTLMSNGGNGTDGDAGSPYEIDLESRYGSIFNSGKLQANGGNAAGGDASGDGYIYVYPCWDYAWGSGNYGQGNFLNSGAIEAKGGNSTTGDGGYGGDLYAEVWGGDFVNSATIDLKGGNGKATDGYSGGDGGYIEVYTWEGYDNNFLGDYVPAGDMIFAGNIYLQGGTGDYGGSGGDMELYCGDYYYYGVETSAAIYAYGYRLIDARGGAGTDGGDGGYIDWVTYCGWDDGGSYYTLAGPVIAQCDFNTSGGNGTDGYGGDAEDVWLVVDINNDGEVDENSVVDFRGNVIANGGTGTDGGGYGTDSDEIWIQAPSGITVTGNITSNGGNATAAGGYGGDAEYGVYVWSDGDITITGNVTLVGGNGMGSGYGGYGGYLDFDYCFSTGEEVLTLKGNVNVNGGNGGSDGDGGSGGWVYFDTLDGFVSVTGNISANGGTGAGTGDGGYGGEVYFYTYADVDVTGNLTTRGGNATGTGDGGSGYYIYIETDSGSVAVHGTIDASGGSGDQWGGDGGNTGYTPGIYLCSDYGDVVEVVGNIINRGGNAKDDGQGGYAGPVQLYAPKNAIVLGSIDASGGDVIGPTSGSVGGDGSGIVELFSNLGSMVSGTVNVDGGTADTDGDDGYFYMDGTQYLP